MRRPWSVRLMRACLALWFVLSGGELGLAHGCPMHDGLHAAAASSHMPSGHHGMPGAMGEHHQPASHDHSSHACTCVGACSAPSAVASVGATPTVLATVARRATQAPLDDTGIVPGGRAPHALPFANGPPAVLRTA